MNLLEHQAKSLFASAGIPVPAGEAAASPEEAQRIARDVGFPVMVKAQIHAGGRGKAGGILVAEDEDTVRDAVQTLLGRDLVTAQTGPSGQRVGAVLVERMTDVACEAYLSVAIDRARRRPVLIASRAGGVEIEEVARKTPEQIAREWIEPAVGLRSFQIYRLARSLGWGESTRAVTRIIASLARLFADRDALLAEINPLVRTADGEVLALDAKVSVDDNALFRHEDLASLREAQQEEPLEARARGCGLNYIKLDGSVGCLVNGAGLAMATMDLIQHVGASPANFLDVGGGASQEMVAEGFRILLEDPDVRAVFINIFGGILRCDVLAEGVVAAAQDREIGVPVVVRLEGTNVEEGRRILEDSGVAIQTATDLEHAAALVAVAAEGTPE
jgi:succinyl-CoA synthetase beta subunit